MNGRIDRSDVLSREILAEGFYLEGRRVLLLGPQGIFKPAVRRFVEACGPLAPRA